MGNENKPLVSVIIPTYKRKSITRAIESVLSQNYPNIDIWVIDDNAEHPEFREYTKQIAMDFSGLPQVHFLFNDVNLGGALTRNVGIVASKGELVAFLDDDDWYLQGKISKQVDLLTQDTTAAMVYCWSRGESSNGTVVWVNHKSKEGQLLFEAMTDDCIASTSLIMCRRDALDAVGLFEDMPCKQDVFLELKFAAAGFRFRCVREELVVYGNLDDGFERISNVSEKTVRGFQKCRDLSRANFNQLDKKLVKLVEANYSFQLCRVAKQIGDRKLFCDEMKNSFKYQRNIRRLMRIILDFLTFNR